MGAAPVNIHKFYEHSCISGKLQEHQEDDEQYDGDKRPHFVLAGFVVCLEFRYVLLGTFSPFLD
jgi:hypothetical protein